MRDIVDNFSHDLAPPSSKPSSPSEKHDVVLTGSTSSLGKYILEELLAEPSISHVYCLNRSSDAEERHRKSFVSRSVKADFSRVAFLQTDISKVHFGLSGRDNERLLDTVDIFVHNVWSVDFNESLESYEDVHIASTWRVVDFSVESKHRAHIDFICSIARVGNCLSSDTIEEGVPETLPDDSSLPLPLPQGYGESKHVASRILATAADRAAVPGSVIRAGHLAGSSKQGTEWNKHE